MSMGARTHLLRGAEMKEIFYKATNGNKNAPIKPLNVFVFKIFVTDPKIKDLNYFLLLSYHFY